MSKRVLVIEIGVVTIIVLALLCFWACNPILTFYSLMSSGKTEADIIREWWHFRLVQPEWIGPPIRLERWLVVETQARVGAVLVAWLTSVFALITRYRRAKRRHLTGRPSQPLAIV
jgi:hypothetical protein